MEEKMTYSGKIRIELEDVRHNTLGILQVEISRSKAKVNYDFSLLKSAYYPRKYIDSFFLNLISNSIKYCSSENVP
jgi:light-regulated signal transduction histidine kinase (bacteriophytochrome)